MNISIPLSCVFIMFCFVAFLCYKSYKELEEIQNENIEGKPFELVQAAMVLPLKKTPDLLNSNGKNLWKSAIERLKQEQMKNNPLNQPNTFLSRGSSDQIASLVDRMKGKEKSENNSFADVVHNVMSKSKEKEYSGGTLGLPIITNPNVPSICLNQYPDNVNDQKMGNGSEATTPSDENEKQGKTQNNWVVDLQKNDETPDKTNENRVEVVVEVNKPKRCLADENKPAADVISNKNCSSSEAASCDEPLSKNEFRESIRRESEKRKDKYFPNSPEKKKFETFPPPPQKMRANGIAADYTTVTLV